MLARQRGEAIVPRMLASGAAALLPIIVPPGRDRPVAAADHGSARLRDPIYGRPNTGRIRTDGHPRRLPSRSCLAWYLTLRRWIGATALAIGALLGPAILGLVTAWLLPAMSYYGSLAVIGAGGGA